MPELPDVETFRRYLAATSLHQRVAHVHADPDLLQDLSPAALGRALHGLRLETTHRHGKYLFAATDGPVWLVLHFGMTGGLDYFQSGGQRHAPEHTRLLLEFDNGYRLAYHCQRKLGLVALCDDPAGFVRARGLGPDALAPGMDLETFRGALAGRRTTIKAWLMDQRTIAGIGNIYADELLFHARLHPARRVNELTEGEVERLHGSLRPVLDRTIEARADPARMPESFLLPHRAKSGHCPRCGAALHHERISGRTAYYCPRCQSAGDAR